MTSSVPTCLVDRFVSLRSPSCGHSGLAPRPEEISSIRTRVRCRRACLTCLPARTWTLTLDTSCWPARLLLTPFLQSEFAGRGCEGGSHSRALRGVTSGVTGTPLAGSVWILRKNCLGDCEKFFEGNGLVKVSAAEEYQKLL